MQDLAWCTLDMMYTCLGHFSYLTHQQQFWQLKHQIRIFSGDISILASFVGKFKINLPSKERVPWEWGCTIYTHPQDHLHFQDGWRAVYSVSLVIVGSEMIDNLPPKPWTNRRKKILAWRAWLTWLAAWLAWLAGLQILQTLICRHGVIVSILLLTEIMNRNSDC